MPGFGAHKINSAYQRGSFAARAALAAQGISGAELGRLARQAGGRELVRTVEQLTGAPLNPASPTAPAVAPMATSLPCVS